MILNACIEADLLIAWRLSMLANIIKLLEIGKKKIARLLPSRRR